MKNLKEKLGGSLILATIITYLTMGYLGVIDSLSVKVAVFLLFALSGVVVRDLLRKPLKKIRVKE